jgi:hypothetical protein
VPPEEVTPQQQFSNLDGDGDGMVSRLELNHKIDMIELSTALTRFDKNRDKLMDLYEYLRYLKDGQGLQFHSQCTIYEEEHTNDIQKCSTDKTCFRMGLQVQGADNTFCPESETCA